MPGRALLVRIDLFDAQVMARGAQDTPTVGQLGRIAFRSQVSNTSRSLETCDLRRDLVLPAMLRQSLLRNH